MIGAAIANRLPGAAASDAGKRPPGATRQARFALFSHFLRAHRRALLAVVLFSAFVNLLMLTGPLFMLQIYDRILLSRSMPTLAVIFALVGVLFLFMGALDYLRQQVLGRLAMRMQHALAQPVCRAALERTRESAERKRESEQRTGSAQTPRELEALQAFLASPLPFAFLDLPWSLVFLAVLTAFHWSYGVFAVVATLVLIALAAANEMSLRAERRDQRRALAMSDDFQQSLWQETDTIRGLGLERNVLAIWHRWVEKKLGHQCRVATRGGGFGVASKTLRLFFQSAILALGAALALHGLASEGVIIAASIVLGRMLAPLDLLIGQWTGVVNARQSFDSLARVMEGREAPPQRTALPAPAGQVAFSRVIAGGSPTKPALATGEFAVAPGEALGIVGPSASGKTTLLRALVGSMPLLAGEIRIDGAALEQWDADALGAHIGYVPQHIALFPGTIRDNIARMGRGADDAAVIAAARSAGVHELILGLEDGYDTVVDPRRRTLSGGQRQRIALARAFYGDPAIYALDEPNAHLDGMAEASLLRVLNERKAAGKTVFLTIQRRSLLPVCDKLLVLSGGRQVRFGPAAEVAREVMNVR